MWKKMNVHLLPSEKEPEMGNLVSSVRHPDKLMIFGSFENSYPEECVAWHIYITNDEKVAENDWCVVFDTNLPEKVLVRCNVYGKAGSTIGSNSYLEKFAKRIVAATDPILNNSHIHRGSGKYWEDEPVRMRSDLTLGLPMLPSPPCEWVDNYLLHYNEGNHITEVEVEYEEIDSQECHAQIDYKGRSDLDLEYGLKLTNNYITIRPVKEEVVEMTAKDIYDQIVLMSDPHHTHEAQMIGIAEWVFRNFKFQPNGTEERKQEDPNDAFGILEEYRIYAYKNGLSPQSLKNFKNQK